MISEYLKLVLCDIGSCLYLKFINFAFVKSIRIIAVFLSFVLVAPLVSNLLQLNNIHTVELMEQSEEKERSENRESESKDELDELEKYFSNRQNYSSLLMNGESNFFNKRMRIRSFYMDVLNPPPELS